MNENPELEGPHRALIADLALMLAGMDEHECSEWYASTKAVLKAWFKREHREWNDYQLDAAANRVIEAIQFRKMQIEAASPSGSGSKLNRGFKKDGPT